MPLAHVQGLDTIDCEAEAKLRQGGWWASKAFQHAFHTATAALPPANSPEAHFMYDKMAARRPISPSARTPC